MTQRDLLGLFLNTFTLPRKVVQSHFGIAYSGQIFALFILCKEAKKILYISVSRGRLKPQQIKNTFGIFFSNFIVVLCDNFFKFEFFFIILAIFLQNQGFIANIFFASLSLQRIFFAKIFFVCKDCSFAIQYIIALLHHVEIWDSLK